MTLNPPHAARPCTLCKQHVSAKSRATDALPCSLRGDKVEAVLRSEHFWGVPAAEGESGGQRLEALLTFEWLCFGDDSTSSCLKVTKCSPNQKLDV